MASLFAQRIARANVATPAANGVIHATTASEATVLPSAPSTSSGPVPSVESKTFLTTPSVLNSVSGESPMASSVLDDSKLTIFLRPWHVHQTHEVLALQILDQRLIPILQSMVRNLYYLIQARHKTLASIERDWKRTSHSMFVHARRTFCRQATVPRIQSTLVKYAEYSDRPPLQYQSFPPFQFVTATESDLQRAMHWHHLEVNMPFTLPVSMLGDDVVSFHNKDRAYYLLYKSDGVRLLWVACRVGNQTLTFWMDRKGRCWTIPGTHLPDTFYDGTVWDGELVRTKTGKRAFLIFDCLSSCGRTCGEYDYATRMQLAQSGIEEWDRYVPSSYSTALTGKKPRGDWSESARHVVSPLLSVRVKRLFPVVDVAWLIRDCMPRGLDHAMDGIIATSYEDPVVIGGCSTMFKIKLEHPLDFQARFASEAADGCWFQLWTYDGTSEIWVEWKEHGLCFVSNSEGQQHGLNTVRDLHNKIVECRLTVLSNKTASAVSANRETTEADPKFRWRVSLVRHDKRVPNNLETVQKTWLNIQQGLQLSDIFPKEFFAHETTNPNDVPPSWQVLKIREEEHCNWHDRSERAEAIRLPPPSFAGIYATTKLRSKYKRKCAPWSYEGFVHSLLNK